MLFDTVNWVFFQLNQKRICNDVDQFNFSSTLKRDQVTFGREHSLVKVIFISQIDDDV